VAPRFAGSARIESIRGKRSGAAQKLGPALGRIGKGDPQEPPKGITGVLRPSTAPYE
jgi:hypothetical protein